MPHRDYPMSTYATRPLLDEPANSFPDARLIRVKPSVPRKQPRVSHIARCATLLYGVVSAGVPTPAWLVATNRRLRHHPLHHLRDTTVARPG